MTGGAAERLTRSAAKFEAEMASLNGLLGASDAALAAASLGELEAKSHLKRSAKQLEAQNHALKTILYNAKPYLATAEEEEEAGKQPTGIPRATADAIFARLDRLRKMMKQQPPPSPSHPAAAVGSPMPPTTEATAPPPPTATEEAAPLPDGAPLPPLDVEYMRGGFGAAAVAPSRGRPV